MKLLKQNLPFIISAFLISCSSNGNTDNTNSRSEKIEKPSIKGTSELSRFLGTWVSHSRRHFQIVEIKDSSKATVYHFEQWRPTYDTTNKERYAYSKSEGKVSITYKYNLLIETPKFKFSNFLQGDTLFQMAEPGRVDTLLRVYNDSTIVR